MIKLPKLDSIELTGERVFLRADLDVPVNEEGVFEENRVQKLKGSVDLLKENEASQIVIVGHMGRPEGVEESLSLEPLKMVLSSLVSDNVTFIPKQEFNLIQTLLEDTREEGKTKFYLLENIRFWKEENNNDEGFAMEMSTMFDVYVNDSFATAHRKQASVVGVSKFLEHVAGVRFYEEVEKLKEIREEPKRPLVTIMNGVKKDKLDYLEAFKDFSDKVLVGGRLPEYLGEDYKDDSVVVGRLMPDKEDITMNTIEAFESEIAKAGSIILSGPVGKFEDPGHMQGTERVFKAIANSSAYKLAGGGDTQAAIEKLGLTEKFDFISTGGGAMLEFLAHETLPGIQALQD